MSTEHIVHHVEIEGQVRPYRLRRSRRARNILLHVQADGLIEVVVPPRGSYQAAQQFVAQRIDWIARALKKYEVRAEERPRYTLATGQMLPFFGSAHTLKVDINPTRQRTHVREHGYELAVFAPDTAAVQPALEAWYRRASKAWFAETAYELALRLGVRVRSLRISNTKTQWGSASKKDGAIALHWKLALAPPHVALYVAAHEVAHLRHANHSDRFWATVAQLMPAYQPSRAWLRRYGHTLTLAP